MKKFIKAFALVLGVLLVIVAAIFGYNYFRMNSEMKKFSTPPTAAILPQVIAVKDEYLNLYLVQSKNGYIAIDAGQNADNVKAELAKIKIDPLKVKAVLLTHGDDDHSAAVTLFSKATIYISREEEPMINGTRSRVLFFKNRILPQHQPLDDGQTLALDGLTVQAIATPGHTPGSMCYLVDGTMLFTGDTLSLVQGKAAPFNNFFNMDTATEEKSISRLAGLTKVEYVFTAHYGFTDDFEKVFADWKRP